MGIEPTGDSPCRPLGFEDREGHQYPIRPHAVTVQASGYQMRGGTIKSVLQRIGARAWVWCACGDLAWMEGWEDNERVRSLDCG